MPTLTPTERSMDRVFTIGERVTVYDPTWHRHGDAGTVLSVGGRSKRVIRVQMDSHPLDVVKGSPLFFLPEQEA